jgi:hypothetical protein
MGLAGTPFFAGTLAMGAPAAAERRAGEVATLFRQYQVAVLAFEASDDDSDNDPGGTYAAWSRAYHALDDTNIVPASTADAVAKLRFSLGVAESDKNVQRVMLHGTAAERAHLILGDESPFDEDQRHVADVLVYLERLLSTGRA